MEKAKALNLKNMKEALVNCSGSFTITQNQIAYTVTLCTAIAMYDEGDEAARQDALLVKAAAESGEITEDVVFGWTLPLSLADWEDMCEDSSAWEALQDYHRVAER